MLAYSGAHSGAGSTECVADSVSSTLTDGGGSTSLRRREPEEGPQHDPARRNILHVVRLDADRLKPQVRHLEQWLLPNHIDLDHI